jgi:xanthine dehydrogenase YagS FAD-binding subunit
MRGFELDQPRSLPEALDLLNGQGMQSRPLGGGTDLVAGVMRDQVMGVGMPYPARLVDLATVPELEGIRLEGEMALIGAATTLTDIAQSSELRRRWPMLTEAADNVGTPEIRAIGTLGGNIHQRPRCWFFRSKDFHCIKKGGDICYAVKGDNRYNAIVGGQLCYIVHPSDLAMTLLALGAQAKVASMEHERLIAFDDYFVGPHEDVLRESVLRPEELLTEVIIPPAIPGTRQVWEKINEKGVPSWDFAVLSLAATMVVEGGVWREGRIVLGGVSPVPYRATCVEEALVGRDVRTALPEAAAAMRRVARPMRDNGYKVEMVEALIERALLEALEHAPVPERDLADDASTMRAEAR